ncbi:MAG: hypothetical protein AB7F88_11755 [Pyrinomonadaceae bacterium]
MNINLSEKTESKLREIARQQGKDAADLAGVMIEEGIAREPQRTNGRRKLSDMAGMFYGGDEDTAEMASEIMRADMGENSLGRN